MAPDPKLAENLGLMQLQMTPEFYPQEAYTDANDAVTKLESRFASLPQAAQHIAEDHEGQAQLATLYIQRGNYAQAVMLLERVVAQREETLGPNDGATLNARELFAAALCALQKHSQAYDECQKVFMGRSGSLGTDDALTWRAKANMGIVNWDLDKLDEAIADTKSASDSMKGIFGLGDPRTQEITENLAYMLFMEEQAWMAQRVAKSVLEARLKQEASSDVSILKSATLLGSIYLDIHWWPSAEEAYRVVVERRQSLQGRKSPAAIASMSNLANAIQRQNGRVDDAEKIRVEVLDLSREVHGPDHPITLGHIQRLAGVYQAKGEYDTALEMHRNALALQKSTPGVDPVEVISGMTDLAYALLDLERGEEAAKTFKEIISLAEERLGPSRDYTCLVKLDLANLYAREDRWDQVEPLVLEMIDVLRGGVSGKADAVEDGVKSLVTELTNREKTASFNKMYFGL